MWREKKRRKKKTGLWGPFLGVGKRSKFWKLKTENSVTSLTFQQLRKSVYLVYAWDGDEWRRIGDEWRRIAGFRRQTQVVYLTIQESSHPAGTNRSSRGSQTRAARVFEYYKGCLLLHLVSQCQPRAFHHRYRTVVLPVANQNVLHRTRDLLSTQRPQSSALAELRSTLPN